MRPRRILRQPQIERLVVLLVSYLRSSSPSRSETNAAKLAAWMSESAGKPLLYARASAVDSPTRVIGVTFRLHLLAAMYVRIYVAQWGIVHTSFYFREPGKNPVGGGCLSLFFC